MKICVLGAGALGCAIGGVLTEAGNEVWLVNRSRAHVDALLGQGLTMREAGVDRVVRVRAGNDCGAIARDAGVMDLIIVLVKSYHTREAIAAAVPLVGADTMVLSLQNGLGHEDVLAEVVGRSRVLMGKTYAGGVLLRPGHVTVGTQGKETLIGELDGSSSERVRRVAEVFSRAGLATQVSRNILGTVWDKLLINVATGAVSAITRLPYGALYQVHEVQACALAAVAEAMAVAQASGIELGMTDPTQAWLKAAAGLPTNFKTSMLQSLEKGLVTEIDYVNGAVVREGARRGVPTPVNQTLLACVKGIEHGLEAPTRKPLPSAAQRAYVEHVALRVHDIRWHINFFLEVLGMDVREIDGPTDAPHQYWTVGGVQLMSTPGFLAPPSNESGWLAHLGVMVQDLDLALATASQWGVKALPQGRNWLQLPDGLALELIQASGDSVAEIQAINPRAKP